MSNSFMNNSKPILESKNKIDFTNLAGHAWHTAKFNNYCFVWFKAKNIKEAFEACNQVLDEDENNIDALCDRAETYIANEQYEKGK